MKKSHMKTGLAAASIGALALVLGAFAVSTLAAAKDKEIKPLAFLTPEAAVQALAEAARRNDNQALIKIYGPAGEDLISSGDDVQDANRRAKFLEEYDASHSVVLLYPDEAELVIGKDHWPFPVRIIKIGKKWFFDTEGGKEEILNRRIGSNELNAMEVIDAFVRAQREYHAVDHDQDEVPEYAQRVMSSKDMRDGLYWHVAEGEQLSPLGPLAAGSSAEGYDTERVKVAPYHGYRYKVLKAQGPDAAGGAFSYMIGENMVAGYALVAWPAEYGNSGVMTFLVNANGIIYQKDLGEKTAEIATAMNQYNPDPTWSRAK